MRKTIFISGLSVDTNNRGTQALGHGALSFLKTMENLNKDTNIISPSEYKNPIKNWHRRIVRRSVKVGSENFTITNRMYWFLDVKIVLLIYKIFGIYFSLSPFGRDVKNMQYTAAICGGDGFSDIYETTTMLDHLKWVFFAKKIGKPYIILPQTIGPFSKESNYTIAETVLRGATKVYVRDTAFTGELEKMNVGYKLTDDLSYYMVPESCDIMVSPNSVGINISGLCYYNAFFNLAGKFDSYKLLIEKIVERFQMNDHMIYLIPHSYNYLSPEENGDDLQASRDFYNSLSNKKNVVLVEQDLRSPQIKYLISKMSYFIGSRMHSCFAAIYTDTPIFGLGYSYKYEHNFSRYGLENNFISVVDMKKEEVCEVVDKIVSTQNRIMSKL